MISNNVTEAQIKILDEVLETIEGKESEIHLPTKITNLDKVGLLMVISELLSKI